MSNYCNATDSWSSPANYQAENPKPKSSKRYFIIFAVLGLVLLGAGVFIYLKMHTSGNQDVAVPGPAEKAEAKQAPIAQELTVHAEAEQELPQKFESKGYSISWSVKDEQLDVRFESKDGVDKLGRESLEDFADRLWHKLKDQKVSALNLKVSTHVHDAESLDNLIVVFGKFDRVESLSLSYRGYFGQYDEHFAALKAFSAVKNLTLEFESQALSTDAVGTVVSSMPGLAQLTFSARDVKQGFWRPFFKAVEGRKELSSLSIQCLCVSANPHLFYEIAGGLRGFKFDHVKKLDWAFQMSVHKAVGVYVSAFVDSLRAFHAVESVGLSFSIERFRGGLFSFASLSELQRLKHFSITTITKAAADEYLVGIKEGLEGMRESLKLESISFAYHWVPVQTYANPSPDKLSAVLNAIREISPRKVSLHFSRSTDKLYDPKICWSTVLEPLRTRTWNTTQELSLDVYDFIESRVSTPIASYALSNLQDAFPELVQLTLGRICFGKYWEEVYESNRAKWPKSLNPVRFH